MLVTVDKGLEMPSRKKYPLDVMEVGDSFPVPLASRGGVHRSIQIQKARTPGRNFAIRTYLSSEGEKIARCWRIK